MTDPVVQVTQPGQPWQERPCYFPPGRLDQFGVLTSPVGGSKGLGVILAWGNGQKPSWGRNRVRTQLARRLAAAGYPCLRFDYRGVGDSGGELTFTLLDPPAEDVVAAVELLRREEGVDVATVGYCAGSRAVLAAVGLLPGLRGALLLSGPILDGAHQDYWLANMTGDEIRERMSLRTLRLILTDPGRRRWARRLLWSKARRIWQRRVLAQVLRRRPPYMSDRVSGPVRRMVEREVPVGFVYGTDDDFYLDFVRAKDEGALGPLLERAGADATVCILEGRAHGFPTTAIQDAVMTAVEGWVEKVHDALVADAKAV
jgi:pimeloyl-ACP methyl ester carboxylesterase